MGAFESEATRENTKQRWKEKTIDLWGTKDSSLLGEIGEVVAWKYLWAQGILVWPFWRVVQMHLFSDYLSKEQIQFLEKYRSMQPAADYIRSFDLVGVRRWSREAYLVEVKTTRSSRYRYD